MKKGIWILVVYVALLITSGLFESLSHRHQPETTSHLHYPAASPSQDAKKQPVLIIHGFFGITDEIRDLAESLHEAGRSVLVPDLYELSNAPEDYSLAGRIPELNLLLEEAGYTQGHVVAFGLGGPAAIALTSNHPDQIISLTLLSASATQKYELLGDYSLNKALYSLQSGAFWALNNLLPDFGLLKKIPLRQEQLRSLADINLRPVEAQLQQIQQPSLVIHGHEDYLIPVQAAEKHHALLAQSQLKLFKTGHVITPDAIPELPSELMSFMHQVESGQFVPHTQENHPHQDTTLTGPRFWFITGLVFIGTKFSEDLATVAAGLLVSRDVLPFWVAVVVCFFGIMAGDTAIYFFGRFAGIGILRKRPLRWIISEQQVVDSEEWFEKRGLIVIVLSRFVPATRFPVYMATGILGVSPLKFISVLGAAALIWTPLIVGLAALLGAPLLNLMEQYERWSLFILLGFFITIILLIKILLPLATRRGRKLFYVRWQRLWRPARKRVSS